MTLLFDAGSFMVKFRINETFIEGGVTNPEETPQQKPCNGQVFLFFVRHCRRGLYPRLITDLFSYTSSNPACNGQVFCSLKCLFIYLSYHSFPYLLYLCEYPSPVGASVFAWVFLQHPYNTYQRIFDLTNNRKAPKIVLIPIQAAGIHK